MDEQVATDAPPRDAESGHGQAVVLIVQGSLLLGEVVAFIWLIQSIASSGWVQALCLGQFVLAMTAASASLYLSGVRRRQLYDPLQRLEALLPEVRAGEAPIDDLSGIDGRMAPLAHGIQQLFRDLRAQKALLAAQELELRQKVMNRTEALERKIGSLKNQATRDVLTGLLNRRALDEHLAKVIERCVANCAHVSVLMVDVDNFKPLNDTLGHAAGDELLRSLGQLFRSTLRENDVAFRCGGDEFVIVLEGSDGGSARPLADRLITLVDGLTRTLKVAARPRLSIGVASLNELTTPTGEALLEEADKRLYAIKEERKGERPARGSAPAKVAMKPTRRKSDVASATDAN